MGGAGGRTFAQTAACAFVYGVPFLVPDLRDQFGLSLAAAGAYVAAPTAGLLATLIAWGAAADRFGERKVMASGLLLAALAVGVVGAAPRPRARPRAGPVRRWAARPRPACSPPAVG